MDEIAGLVSPSTSREPLCSQLKSSLKQVCKQERPHIVEKATEDCLIVCKVIAPNNGEELFESITTSTAGTASDHLVSDELIGLMTAYKMPVPGTYQKTNTESVRIQISHAYIEENP